MVSFNPDIDTTNDVKALDWDKLNTHVVYDMGELMSAQQKNVGKVVNEIRKMRI